MEATAVGQWQTLWSDIYSQSEPSRDEDLNLAGWTSSYTGRPIAPREMAEWLDRTVERILDLRPRRLLEIGCGMGLLLRRLAPACEECWGIDFSAEAVAALRQNLAGRSLPVVVRQQAADDLRGLPRGTFDTVVLNSVVQYFPSVPYLLRVLSSLRGLLAPGARIFLGDLRSRPHLSTFHLSVLLQQADGATPLAEIRERLESRVRKERELLLAPAFFTSLPGLAYTTGIEGIAAVDVQLKRGRAKNELTRFRYDVILTLAGGAEPAAPAPERRLDWRQAGLSIAGLRRLLAAEKPASLRVSGVPNARLAAEVAAESLLRSGDSGLATVADLKRAAAGVPGVSGVSGVEPEDLWGLSRDLPYRVGVHWGASPETLDVVLRHL
jgi:SAM-dependent methyltransferase